MKVDDFPEIMARFISERHPNNRYASFDYCYSYFHPRNKHLRGDLERGALELGFFLASWGMLRGSSFLLSKSYRHFLPLIEYIYTCPDSVWNLDCDTYSEEGYESLIHLYNKIKELLIPQKQRDLTIVTKVMLGVFANTPAFDQFFVTTFTSMYRGRSSFNSFDLKSLRCISDFYLNNQHEIQATQESSFILKHHAEIVDLRYSKAKIIDMYGFTKGLLLNP